MDEPNNIDQTIRKALSHGPDCPPLEQLLEAVENRQANSKIVQHADSCAACKTEIALYERFSDDSVLTSERSDVAYVVRRLRGVQTPPPSKGLGAWLRALWTSISVRPALAGGFAMVAAAALFFIGLPAPKQIKVPVAESDAIVLRSSSIRVSTQLDDLKEFPEEIRWEPVRTANSYDVTLAEVDRTARFHKNVTTPSIHVPEETRTMVVPGRPVVLHIVALDANGREVADSGPLLIHVQRGGAN